jgi:hypothetical protein
MNCVLTFFLPCLIVYTQRRCLNSGQFFVSSLTFWKVHFVSEHNIHESTCRAHLNITQFSFNKSQPAMCCRSVWLSQELIRSDRDLDVIYDVTGFTGWILGVPDFQPGGGAQTSTLQGPSGTFTWRFLQAGCRGQHLHLQYIWCMQQIHITLLATAVAHIAA